MKKTLKPVVASVSAAFLLGTGTQGVLAEENPFAAQQLTAGYQQLADAKSHEGKCGEAKCGADAAKAKEGRCGEGHEDKEDKCHHDGEKAKKEGDAEKAAEGKCGEGKCGGNM